MVCHINKETGGLTVLIPVCIKCKRQLKRETFQGIGDGSMTMTAPMAVREVTFACPKGHALFKVGALDLSEMAKYPTDKIVFESAPNLNPGDFPVLEK